MRHELVDLFRLDAAMARIAELEIELAEEKEDGVAYLESLLEINPQATLASTLNLIRASRPVDYGPPSAEGARKERAPMRQSARHRDGPPGQLVHVARGFLNALFAGHDEDKARIAELERLVAELQRECGLAGDGSMTQATDELTAEELATLAGITGLELRMCGYFTPYPVYFVGGKSFCLPKDFRPDQNWSHLGMVVDGLAERGRLLQLGPISYLQAPDLQGARFVSGDMPPGEWEWFEPSRIKIAVCRAALVAIEMEQVRKAAQP